MRILIEIGHPAHVHFFKGVMSRLRSAGHEILIVTRNKEITDKLLIELGYEYISISTPAATTLGLIIELSKRWWKIWRILKESKIDIAVSISGISTAFPAWLRGIPNLIFTDTEDASLSNSISFPFSTCIVTPTYFLKELGARHIRYRGLHELAYLQEFNHDNLELRLSDLGIYKPYFVIRLIGYDALHDRTITRSPEHELFQLIEFLQSKGRVYLSSQRELPRELASLELKIPLTRIHEVLAGALMFVGESPTMAVEASLLGTPALLVSSRSLDLGNMIGLAKQNLLCTFESFSEAARFIENTSNLDTYKEEWRRRAHDFVESSERVTKYVSELIVETGLNQKRS